jgi:hypothetical protein
MGNDFKNWGKSNLVIHASISAYVMSCDAFAHPTKSRSEDEVGA